MSGYELMMTPQDADERLERSAADRADPEHALADDSGFTPAEIIIGVILLAILSTSVVAQALQLRQQAQDSAAQTTLRSAVTAARSLYALTLPGGQNNFVGVRAGATTLADFAHNSEAEAAAVAALAVQEPNIQFKAYSSLSFTSGVSGRVQTLTPSTTTVWVQVPYNSQKNGANPVSISQFNPNGFSPSDGLIDTVPADVNIRPGDMIRLGIVSASGSSFCAILVADSSDGTVSGAGFQSVSEKSTQAGYGADCGAADSSVNTAATSASFKEMPGTIGTDPSLSRPVDVTSGTAYGGNSTKA